MSSFELLPVVPVFAWVLVKVSAHVPVLVPGKILILIPVPVLVSVKTKILVLVLVPAEAKASGDRSKDKPTYIQRI